jgi:hypothetical protein
MDLYECIDGYVHVGINTNSKVTFSYSVSYFMMSCLSGWHICSICEKAAHYMCYTCTYSLCKGCISQGDFFGVRGNKGFCDTCYGTILLIESKDGGSKVCLLILFHFLN